MTTEGGNPKQSLVLKCLGLCALLMASATGLADTVTVDFESPAYSPGDVNGQDGWRSGGTYAYDEAVVSSSLYPSFGGQSLRISNAVTSGAFDQTYAKPLNDAVGEIDATSGSFAPGTIQTLFSAEFDIASALPTAQQDGLTVSVSPDRGDGSRMSYLGFTDGADGIDVTFYDVPALEAPCASPCDDFVATQVAAGLDRTVPHHIKLTLDTVDGMSNDTVTVYIDGNPAYTGTSWENYYRYDAEASAEPSPRIVKTLIFMARGGANPSVAGKGFLFDNVTFTSSTRAANGSFENGPTGTYAYIPGGSSDVTGWTTTQHGVEWFDPNIYGIGSAKDGQYAVDLAPYVYTGGGIKQDVATVPGQYYQVTFYGATSTYSGRDGTGEVDVLINGNLSSYFDLVNHATALNWQRYTALFQATTPTTTIEFRNNQDPYAHFAMIDRVNVAAARTPVGANDLTVDSVSVSPSPAAVGETVTVTATVSNAGAKAADNFDVAMYKNQSTPPTLSQTPDGHCAVSTLAPGATTTCTFTTSYSTDGTVVAWVTADAGNTDTETNETNNTNHVGLGVRYPDLRVIGFTVPSGSYTVGQPVPVSAVVENVSAVDTVHGFQVDIYGNLSSAPTLGQVGDITCPHSAPAAALAAVTCSGSLTYAAPGTYHAWVLADSMDTVKEVTESNNVQDGGMITVVAPYTLTLATAGAGTGTVTGAGSYNSGDSVTVGAVADSGSHFDGWSGTNAAECTSGTVVMTANKSCTATFSVASPPDLTISGLLLSPSPVAVGETLNVSMTVANGGGSAANNFDVAVYKSSSTAPSVGQPGDGVCHITTLAAGGSAPCSVTISYSAAGTNLIWALADAGGSVAESSETNNYTHQGISVRVPDLRVVGLSAAPSVVSAGTPTTITATVENVSAVDVYNAFQIDLYQDLASAPAVSQVGDTTCSESGLGPLAKTTCSLTVTYAVPGTYQAYAQADTLNSVAEGSESNNTKEVSVTVKP